MYALLAFAMAAMVLVSALAGAASADDGPPPAAPTLSSDSETYAPGEQVELTGSGWLPGQLVHVHVADGDGHGWSHDDDVLAAADGTITVSFALPTAFAGSFAAVATGTLGQSASASLTSAFAASSTPPTIVSDQADYGPGETVTLTGAGWGSGEVVHVVVNDDTGQTWSYSTEVTADAGGGFTHAFVLPVHFVATYTVTATGGSGRVATTTFTDGNVRARSNAAGIAFSLDWVEYDGTQNCTGAVEDSGTESAVGFSGGARFSRGVPNANSITLQAAATSNAGLLFNGWTSTDGFVDLGNRIICVPGNFTGTREYVANYVANSAPVAVNDSYTTPEDTPLTVAAPGVLGNDTDADGQPLTVATPRPVTAPATGTLTLNANGSFTYTPAANASGVVTFTYRATDGIASSNLATVTINVTPVNDPPVAANDSYTTAEDTPLTVAAPGVLGNDSDVEGALTVALPRPVSGPLHGSLTLNADGSLTYTPNANFNGSDSFTYRATDGSLSSNLATVSLTVNAVDDAPVAANDSYTTAEDTPLTVAAPGVLGNDTDVDSGSLTVALPRPVGGPLHGSLTLNADGSLTYTPNANFNGSDSFTYRATDGSLSSSLATVTISVTAVNDAPVANGDSYTVAEDGTLTIPAPGVLGNDTDVDGDGLTVAAPRPATNVSHGSLTLTANGSFTYTPSPNFNGSDSFTYEANDGTVDSAAATVSITVTEVNDAPDAVGDSVSVAEDGAVTFDPRANDSRGPANESGQTLTITLVTDPPHGTAAIVPSGPDAGKVTYTPDADYNGPDGFIYTIQDNGTTNGVPEPLTDTATVAVTVDPVNDRPTALDHTVHIDEDAADEPIDLAALVADVETDDADLTYTIVAAPTKGSLTGSGGSRSYDVGANANGTDTFTYSVTDRGDPDDCGGGPPACDAPLTSDVETVTIAIRPINDVPTAQDVSKTMAEDGPALAIDLRPHVVDVETGDADLTYTIVTPPAAGEGTLSATATIGVLSFDSADDFNGTVTATYRVTDRGDPDGCSGGPPACDGPESSTVKTITIDVTEVNDPPVAADDTRTTAEDTALSFDASSLAGNDSPGPENESGQALAVTAVGTASHGSVALVAGTVTYTPDPNYNGPDSFTYTVEDDGTTNGAADPKTDTATVHVTVTEVNDPPVAVDDAGSVAEDSPTGVLVDVLANDTEGPANESGQTLTITLVGSPSHGTAVVESGKVRYTPTEADYNGSDSFAYTITDDGTTNGAADPKTDSATVNVTVTPVNDAPVVTAGSNVSGTEAASVSVSASFTDVDAGDSHTCAVSWGDGSPASAGAVTEPTGSTPGTCSASHAYADDNPTGTAGDAYTVTITVSDDGTTNGAADPKSDGDTLTATIANVAPQVSGTSGPAAPVSVATASTTGVNVTASYTDAGAKDTHSCTFGWDDLTPTTTVAGSPMGSGSCTANHKFTAPGVYTVGVTVVDDDTGSATGKYEYVVVYDPSGGFVTGGGWIDSPAGAYRPDPSLTGKANFGFVSKYKKGASVPEGQTEFQFHAAGLNFHSDAYQWLVVAGSKAQFKGTGKIGGVPGYGFLLTAGDGNPDRFRIKIWALSDGSIVYDNKLGASDDIDAANPQAISAGSIVIHK